MEFMRKCQISASDVSLKLKNKFSAMIKSQVRKSMESYHPSRTAASLDVIEKFALQAKKSKSRIERIWAIIIDANEPSHFSSLVDDLRNSTEHLSDGINNLLDEKDVLVAEGLKSFIEKVNSLLLSQINIHDDQFKSQRRGCYVTVFRRELESYNAIAFEYLDEFSKKNNAQFSHQMDALSSSISDKINLVGLAFQKCSRQAKSTEKCFKFFMEVSLHARDESR